MNQFGTVTINKLQINDQVSFALSWCASPVLGLIQNSSYSIYNSTIQVNISVLQNWASVGLASGAASGWYCFITIQNVTALVNLVVSNSALSAVVGGVANSNTTYPTVISVQNYSINVSLLCTANNGGFISYTTFTSCNCS